MKAIASRKQSAAGPARGPIAPIVEPPIAAARIGLRTPPAPQMKLMVSQPGDALEREADRVAEAVTRAPAAGSRTPFGSPPLRTGEARIQRKCARCDAEDDHACSCVQRKASSSGGVPAVIDAPAIAQRAGRPLPTSERSFFEPRFGVDFSRVRIHTDEPAARLARQLQAQAFTMGNQIVFGTGRYAPATSEGKRLLAHELAHVVQQSDASGGAMIQRQPDPLAYPRFPSPASSRPAFPAFPAGPVGGVDPDYEHSDHYDYEGVTMCADAERMTGALRNLFARVGIKGADDWHARLVADGGIPHAGCPSKGSCHQDTRPTQAESRKLALAVRLAPRVVPVARAAFHEVRTEATDYLTVFEAELERTLLATLRESEIRIETERARYGITGAGSGSGAEYHGQNTVAFQGVVGAAHDLAALRRRHIDLDRQRRHLLSTERRDDIEAELARVDAEYERQLASASLRYPALGAVLDEGVALDRKLPADVAEKRLMEVASGDLRSRPGMTTSYGYGGVGAIAQVLDARLHAIQKVRYDVASDPKRLWKLPAIVALTRMRLPTDGWMMEDTLVDEKVKLVAEDRSFLETALAVLTFALAIIAAIPTGGASVAVAATVTAAGFGLAAISGYQLIKDIKEYELQRALTSTDLNRRAAAISQDEPSLFWLALDLAFFAADGAAALKAFGMLRGKALTALRASSRAEMQAAEAELRNAADGLHGVLPRAPGQEARSLGKRLLDRLAALRGRSSAARALGEAGEAEAAAVTRATGALAHEASTGKTVATVAGHEVKVTGRGVLVICSTCTWLREPYAREIAASEGLRNRVEAIERALARVRQELPPELEHKIKDLVRDMEKAKQLRIAEEEAEAAKTAASETRTAAKTPPTAPTARPATTSARPATAKAKTVASATATRTTGAEVGKVPSRRLVKLMYKGRGEAFEFDDAVDELVRGGYLSEAELRRPGFKEELRAAWDEAVPMYEHGPYVEVEPGWKPVKGGCEEGCEAAAVQIGRTVDGKPHRITPRHGAANLGPFDGVPREWKHHVVVVKDGRVYDMSTGHEGLPIAAYKRKWENASVIDFGF